MKRTIFAASAILALTAFTGLRAVTVDIDENAKLEDRTITISASGESNPRAPECADFTLSITSSRQPTAEAAQQKNADAVKKLLETIKQFQNTKKVTVTGAMPTANTERENVDREKGTTRLLYPDRWDMTTTISFQTDMMDKLTTIFVALNNEAINAAKDRQINDPAIVTISRASVKPNVHDTTRKVMKKEALQAAIKNAKEELETISQEFNIPATRLASVSQSSRNYYSGGYETRAMAAPKMGGGGAGASEIPVSFDDVVEQDVRTFVFDFGAVPVSPAKPKTSK